MARLHLTVGTSYKLRGDVFTIRQILIGGRFLVENHHFGGTFDVSLDDLIHAWECGDLIFPMSSPTVSLSSKPSTEYTLTDFQNISERVRDEAWRRYQIILPLLKHPHTDLTRTRIEAHVAKLQSSKSPSSSNTTLNRGGSPIGEALSGSSVWRWLRAFIKSGYDIRSLVPQLEKRARKGELRVDSEVESIVHAVLSECALTPIKRTANDVYLMIIQENRMRPDGDELIAPSATTIYRRIKATNLTILNPRKGKLEIQADAQVDDGPNPTRILERVEIDNTLLDLFIVDEEDRLPIGRPTLTYALDVFSGFPCGIYLGFEPPSYRTAASCLYHSIMPKGDVQKYYDTTHDWPVYGLMETLVVDNGKEFIGHDLRDACGQLGIILEVLPVKTPWFKGSIERFFRTNNTGLIHSLPGTTFSNILDRGEYDSMHHACISLKAFWKLLHIFLLDVYAQKWHEGKHGIPYKCWQQNLELGFSPVLHTSAEKTRILLMRSEERTIQRAGIQFEWLFYRSRDLMRLRSQLPDGTQVRFKYDPSDISAIYVTDPLTGQRIRVPVAHETRAYAQGLSLWKHRMINRYVQVQKQEVNIEALAEAKAKIQRIVEQEYRQTRKNRGRKTAARILGIEPSQPISNSSSGSNVSTEESPSLVNIHTPSSKGVPELNTETTTSALTKASRTKAKSKADPITAPTSSMKPSLNKQDTHKEEDLDLTGWGGSYEIRPSGDVQ